MALPLASIAHALPGRLRLRVEEKRRDAAWLEALRQALAVLPGVQSVEIKPLTASVLLTHQGEQAALLEAIATTGLVRIADALAPAAPASPVEAGATDSATDGAESWSDDTPSALSDWVAEGTTGIDHRIRALTRGELDFGSVAFVVLVSMGVVQLVRGQAFPPAVTLLWEAVNALVLERGGPAAALLQSRSASARSVRSQGRSMSSRPS